MLLGVLGTVLYQQRKDEKHIQLLRNKLAEILKSDFDLEKLFETARSSVSTPKTLSTKTTTPSTPKKKPKLFKRNK